MVKSCETFWKRKHKVMHKALAQKPAFLFPICEIEASPPRSSSCGCAKSFGEGLGPGFVRRTIQGPEMRACAAVGRPGLRGGRYLSCHDSAMRAARARIASQSRMDASDARVRLIAAPPGAHEAHSRQRDHPSSPVQRRGEPREPGNLRGIREPDQASGSCRPR